MTATRTPSTTRRRPSRGSATERSSPRGAHAQSRHPAHSTAETRSGEGTWLRPLRTPSVVPGRRTFEFSALMVLTLGLTFVGLIMVLSASTVTGLETTGTPWYHLVRQGMWATIGLVAMSVVMRLDYRDLARFSPIFLGLTIVLMIMVLVPAFSIEANGARRWLRVGPFSMQPSELAKLAVALFAADLLSRRTHLVHNNRAVFAPIMIVALGLAALVLLQPSQGTATILVVIALLLLFLGGVSIWTLGMTSGALLAAFFALAMMTPYRRRRLSVWADPFSDPDGQGYQTVQSLIGIATGGLDGVGLGEGRSKWGFLPFAHTDFIFSVVAEELGFIGGVALIVLYLALVGFGMRVAARAPDRLGQLLAAGITCAIALQAFINIGAAISLLPISGVTLPFVSTGGSSLLVNLMAMGVVLNISRQIR